MTVDYLRSHGQGSSSSGDITIHQLVWGAVQMYNTTITCTEEAVAGSSVSSGAPPVTLVAETAAQLQWGIQVLGQLQPSTITLARDMSVPADRWPQGLVVNMSMVLEGLPPPAPRTLLDLYQVGGRHPSGMAPTLNPRHPSGMAPTLNPRHTPYPKP